MLYQDFGLDGARTRRRVGHDHQKTRPAAVHPREGAGLREGISRKSPATRGAAFVATLTG